MNTIIGGTSALELREKRAKVWDEAKNFLDSKQTKDGYISDEDSKVYEKMEQEVLNLGKEIDRLERQASIDLELSKAVNSPILTKPSLENQKNKIGRASDDYKSAFWNAMKYNVKDSLHIKTDPEGGYLVPDEVRPDRALLKVA